MFSKLFIFSFAWIIFQVAIFLPYTYAQEDSDAMEQEFLLLAKEKLLGLISDPNAKRILKGERPQPDNPMDMDLSFTWWESSRIFKAKLGNKVWKEMPDGTKITYLQRFESITDPISVEDPHLNPRNMYKSYSKEPLKYGIPEIGIERIEERTPPNLAWTPKTTWKPVIYGYDKDELSSLSKWEYKRSEPYRRDVIMAASMGAASLVGYLLSKKSKDKEYVAKSPPQSPECWTACAAGEPKWNKPPLPNSGKEMTLEEWEQHTELHGWYVRPGFDERVPLPYRVYTYGSAISLSISINYVAHALWKHFHKKNRFPE